MKRSKKVKVPSNVINFKQAIKKLPATRKIMMVEFWKEKGAHDFSYRINKFGKKQVSDDFAAYGLTCVIEDILQYNEDPAKILELTEEMIARLGFEVEDEQK